MKVFKIILFIVFILLIFILLLLIDFLIFLESNLLQRYFKFFLALLSFNPAKIYNI